MEKWQAKWCQWRVVRGAEHRSSTYTRIGHTRKARPPPFSRQGPFSPACTEGQQAGQHVNVHRRSLVQGVKYLRIHRAQALTGLADRSTSRWGGDLAVNNQQDARLTRLLRHATMAISSGPFPKTNTSRPRASLFGRTGGGRKSSSNHSGSTVHGVGVEWDPLTCSVAPICEPRRVVAQSSKNPA